MKFADLFSPTSEIVPKEDRSRIVRIVEIPTINPEGRGCLEKGETNERSNNGTKAGGCLSAPSATVLVPLDAAFVEGHRYRLAGATEFATRLDLFCADPGGPWVRRHGVLIAVEFVRGRYL